MHGSCSSQRDNRECAAFAVIDDPITHEKLTPRYYLTIHHDEQQSKSESGRHLHLFFRDSSHVRATAAAAMKDSAHPVPTKMEGRQTKTTTNVTSTPTPSPEAEPSTTNDSSKDDSLKLSQERQDFYEMLQRAAESGEVTDELRYHLQKSMGKKEEMSLIEAMISHRDKGLGDSSVLEGRLRELLDRDEQKAEEKEKRDLLFGQQFGQFFFSAFLVLVLLGSWTWTTAYFMKQVMRGESEPDYETHPGYDYVIFIHNVLFGLVTAVVIQELGEEAKDTSLYHRFLPTFREQRRRQKEYRILKRKAMDEVVRNWRGRMQSAKSSLIDQRRYDKSTSSILHATRLYAGICTYDIYMYMYIFIYMFILMNIYITSLGCVFFKTFLMGLILWSTRLYIIVWICLGTSSFVFGAYKGIDTSNLLYTTGQTWLGIAVTIGYSYFGLNGKVAPKLEDANEKIDHSNKDAAVQGGTTDGSDGANGREDARFTEPPVTAASTKQAATATPAVPSSGKANEATSARNKKNSSAPFSSGTKVQPTPTGNSTAPSTPRKKQAAEVTPDPPSFEDMKLLGRYKDEYGTTFQKYQATPDGNCLPYAVNGSNDFQKMIETRNGAAQYIELNRVHYEDVFDDIVKVIADIRKVNAPLGNEFLQVFADWTGDTIISYVSVEGDVDRIFTFTPSKKFDSASPSGETRFVIYNNVNHHDGLRLIDNSSKEEADEDRGKEDDEDGGDYGDDLSKEEEGVIGDNVEGEDERNVSK